MIFIRNTRVPIAFCRHAITPTDSKLVVRLPLWSRFVSRVEEQKSTKRG